MHFCRWFFTRIFIVDLWANVVNCFAPQNFSGFSVHLHRWFTSPSVSAHFDGIFISAFPLLILQRMFTGVHFVKDLSLIFKLSLVGFSSPLARRQVMRSNELTKKDIELFYFRISQKCRVVSRVWITTTEKTMCYQHHDLTTNKNCESFSSLFTKLFHKSFSLKIILYIIVEVNLSDLNLHAFPLKSPILTLVTPPCQKKLHK